MYNLVAPCLFGLEKTVAYELKLLGATNIKITDGRVSFTGDDEVIVKANICLRTAERVQIEVGKFPCKDFDQLYDGIFKQDYTRYIPNKDCKFTIARARSVKSKLTSIPAIQKVANKAMADRLMEIFRTNILSESSDVEIAFKIFINKDEAHLYIDTTGEALHKRGYREKTVAAPLRETIAAFMVMLARWKTKRPLYDITCGSGTIAIEAALIGLNIQAGINRNFAGENLPFIDKKKWNEIRSKYINLEDYSEFKIYACDIDPEAIEIAKENAELAGVADYIDFSVKDVKEVKITEQDGYIICNPPYGVRIGDDEELEDLYASMKKLFKSLDNFSYFIITPDENIGEKVGIDFSKNRKIYNGTINTHLYQYLSQKRY